jgi:allophanate hydrolase subunit 2
VQDGGRPGRAWSGIPAGGWLVPALAWAANRAVGNPVDAAAIEHFGPLAFAPRGGGVWVAFDGITRWVAEDHVCTVEAPAGRVGYVAVAGGLDTPIVCGARGASVAAGIGRALGVGERVAVAPAELAVGSESGSAGPARSRPDPAARSGARESSVVEADPIAPIRVVRGPDVERFAPEAWDTFLASPWRVGPADRVGMRLVGPGLLRSDTDVARSMPMVPGAIQVPADGAPIVLGPDHPTTGGYPLIGVVIRVDRGALFAKNPGAAVAFVEVDPAEARPSVIQR